MTDNALAPRELRSEDIVLGRGRGSFQHPGNRTMLRVVATFKPTYQAATKSKKSEIVRQCIETIRYQGGVFVKKLPTGGKGMVHEVFDKKVVYEKISHCLREQAKTGTPRSGGGAGTPHDTPNSSGASKAVLPNESLSSEPSSTTAAPAATLPKNGATSATTTTSQGGGSACCTTRSPPHLPARRLGAAAPVSLPSPSALLRNTRLSSPEQHPPTRTRSTSMLAGHEEGSHQEVEDQQRHELKNTKMPSKKNITPRRVSSTTEPTTRNDDITATSHASPEIQSCLSFPIILDQPFHSTSWLQYHEDDTHPENDDTTTWIGSQIEEGFLLPLPSRGEAATPVTASSSSDLNDELLDNDSIASSTSWVFGDLPPLGGSA